MDRSLRGGTASVNGLEQSTASGIISHAVISHIKTKFDRRDATTPDAIGVYGRF
jgi:hypothetical protein